ncbi:PREDICTED: uncharacterized protein LOC108565847 [Nicrophorus vespilloides]|uniref:Uncharacterized protein LOC108565847 n=1 Tax=Nicrophorus vespilloides TaxID=110193 RepID=A0ABM1N2D7_NICVS|nr:PREDICTED: uncharacterized protein LOC108565847 [Nicrophorus vespilloides]
MMSKYTQANAPPPPNDNEYYENVRSGNYGNSEDLLIEYDSRLSGRESNANYQSQQAPQEFEMHCKCVYPQRHRGKYSSEQNIVAANRNLGSMSRLDNASQFSLDRKPRKQQHQQQLHHTYTCEQNQKILQRLERDASVKRMRSPEVVNTHRGTTNLLYDGYGPESCAITSYTYDKDVAVKCDDYGFRKGQGVKRTSERSNGQAKRRPAGDGMDSQMDDPELIFEVSDQIRDCPCACDHVIYGPGYTTCLQVSDIYKII